MADSSAEEANGENAMEQGGVAEQSSTSSALQKVDTDTADVDENDSLPLPPSPPLSSGDGNPYPRREGNDNDNNYSSSNTSPIIASAPQSKKQKQRDKLQRRVPGSLDLDYITPRIIGMAPPRIKYSDTNDAAAVKEQSNRQKRQKGNDPGELSTFLEKRHARRYLLFNVSDEDADDRSLLLLRRQVVHLPWGSPKIPHPNDGSNNDNITPKSACSSPMRDSPYSFFRRDTTESSATGSGGGKSPSSGTPAISRVMDICYALHAYLSIPPQDLPLELQQQQQDQHEDQSNLQQQSPKLKKKKGNSQKSSTTVACIYCGNGKTRTGVIVACYLRFCNEVQDALSGFDIFCHRRGIKSSSSSSIDDISSHIPPSLRQFFSNFDELVARKQYPYPEPLILQSIHLQGVPVDDMPCVDIFEYGDVMKQQIYSSHDDTSLNEWDDEEGTYKIGQLLDQDFTLVCRFGGEFAGDDQDPSKVLFRYVNSPKFLTVGSFELGMVNVDMMRRYADSFDEEDFLLTLIFEVVSDEDSKAYSSSQKKKFVFGASKFNGSVLGGMDLMLEGWRVLSDAHLSRFPAESENELMMDSSFVLNVLGTEIDFRSIALQLTNGDVESARAELCGGLFGFLFNHVLQQSNMDETDQSRSDQKSCLSSEVSVVSNSATSQTDQSTSYQNDGELPADESSTLTTDDVEKVEPKKVSECAATEDVDQETSNGSTNDSSDSDALVNDNVGQKVVESNVAVSDQTGLVHSGHEDVPLNATLDEKEEGDKHVTTAEGGDETGDDLLCVMRCCGGVGIAILGAEATKASGTGSSEVTSVADSISVHVDQVADVTVAIEQEASQLQANKAHTRQPSSIECLADALTGSADSKVDEQSTIPSTLLEGDEDKEDDQATISEDYMKYRKMLKMGLPTGAVKNAMQRDGLDPEKYITMSKVGLPDGAVRNAMQRDGLDPSLMTVLKSVIFLSDEAEEGRYQPSTEDNGRTVNKQSDEGAHGEERVQDTSLSTNESTSEDNETEPMTTQVDNVVVSAAELSPQSEMIAYDAPSSVISNISGNDMSQGVENLDTEESATAPDLIENGISFSISSEAAKATIEKSIKDENENGEDEVAAKKAQNVEVQEVEINSESEAEPESVAPLNIAAMAAAAAQKRVQPTEKKPDDETESPINIAAMAAAAAQQKTETSKKSKDEAAAPTNIAAMAAAEAQMRVQTAEKKSEDENKAEVLAPMSIAAMAAAAAQKKAQTTVNKSKDEAEVVAPMSIAAMAAAAAQKKAQSAEKKPADEAEVVAPMSIAAMVAAAAQKKAQKAENQSESAGPTNIAAMAAAAAQKKAQSAKKKPTDEAEVVAPMSIAAMAAAAAQKKAQSAEKKPADEAEVVAPMSIAAMAAAAAQKKAQTAENQSESAGPTNIAAMAAAAAQKKAQSAKKKPTDEAEVVAPMSIAAMAAAAAQKKAQSAEKKPADEAEVVAPMSIAAMVAAAAQKKAQTAENQSESAGPTNIAAMAAAAAQKKAQTAKKKPTDEAEVVAPMSIAAMAAAAAQKKAQSAEKKPADEAEVVAPMSIAAMAAAAAQKKAQTAENQSESAGPTNIAAMAAAAAQKKAQSAKKKPTDEAEVVAPMSIAAMAAAAAQKKAQSAEKKPADEAEVVAPMSIAAMAAAAAQKKAQSAEKKLIDEAEVVAPMSIAAMAAAAAQKKAQTAENQSQPGGSMNIAAMAAAAAQKKAQTAEKEPESAGPMNIAAMAAAAAQKRAGATENQSQSAGPMNIAAMAAAAAQKKALTAEKEPESAGPTNIAAMAAAAAQKKAETAENQSQSAGPMNIAAMAAAAAQKKAQTAENQSQSAGPMNIAAMAAAAAQKKAQTAENQSQSAGPMNIGAMAAAAAQKKAEAVEKDSQSAGPMNIAAMAAAAAQKKAQTAENQSQSAGPMNIAAMAAAAAQKKADAAEKDSQSAGPMNIAAMAAAAAKNLSQSASNTEGSSNASSSAEMNAPKGDRDTPSSANEAELTIRNDPTFTKFFKMLKMGLPLDVVKHAMQRDGMDPSIMDLDHDKSLASQRPSKTNNASDEPPLKEDEKYSKYFRMLKMGLPMGAVKNAMQRDGLDPDIMDLDHDKSVASQMKGEEDDGPPLKEDEKYQKYFKMLKMGLPMGAVKNAMQRDGLDPDIMDLDHDKSVASQMKGEDDGDADDGPPLKEDEKYQKYFKMLKMGLPMGAVKNAMQRDGLDPDIMDLDHDKSVASQMKGEDDGDADDGPPLKEDEKYQKYFKMLKMGLPMGAVKNAMQRDGLDPAIMDLDHDKSVASQMKGDDDADDGPPLKEDEKYQKYFKMLKMGLPMGAVKNAMTRDGLDPAIMDLDHNKSVASQMNVELVDKGPPLKEDEKYQKYFKMLKMGLPMGAVKNAMTRDGLDPAIMDLDHDKSVEYQKAMASQKGKKKNKVVKKKVAKEPKKPKVRRKKIFWSPIEESKVDDNSLWSMIKGSYDFESLKIDQAEFESLFTDTSKPGEKKKEAAKPAASKQKKSVQVIDAKRGMNGGIILARLKIEFNVLADMVSEMDSGKLDDTQLKALREFLPTKEERAAIDQYIKQASKTQESLDAAINDFCACEKYMYAMTKVELADEKFECMLFKYQFDNKLNELMSAVTTLISACEEVQKSVRLRKLMAMILMLGNQINTGGTGNMAHGFTLDALLKLDEAKAFDKKTSVLQYLVKLVKGNEPDLLNVHEEMPSIGPAESVVVETLVSELKELSGQLEKVKATATEEGKRIRDTLPSPTGLDKLRQQKTKIKDVEGVNMYNQTEVIHLTPMEKFVVYAENRTKDAFSRTEEVQENFKGVLSYFGESPTMTSTDFFGTLNKFVAAFDAALVVVKRIEALNAAEKKKADAQRAKEEAQSKKKSKIKEAAIKSVTSKIDRLTAEKERKEKMEMHARAKEGLQQVDKQQEFAESSQPKGTLDLTGQRKQFADPFAGPDDDFHETNEATTDTDTKNNGHLGFFPATNPNKSPMKADNGLQQSKVNAKMGFFPATSPQHKIVSASSMEIDSPYDEKNDVATSPTRRATLSAPHNSPFARGIKHEQLSEQKLHLHHIEMPDLDDEKSFRNNDPPPPMGIAAMAAAAAQKKKEKVKDDDHVSSTPPPMGIAAMAAAAAQKKQKKQHEVKEGDNIGPTPPPMGVAAMAAAAAQKKQKKVEESDNIDAPPPPMGIAAMAAAAAQKEQQKSEENDNASSTPPPMGIAAMAAAAAQKKRQKAEEDDSSPPPMGIAAMAAAAAQKKQQKAEVDSVSSAPPPIGIAAMAAAAAQKKQKNAEKDDSSPPPVGIAAMAAAAAQKKQKKVEESDTIDAPPPPMGIAAMAAAAAQKKQKNAGKDDSSHPPMGIAAMAAAAAQKKQKKVEESDTIDAPPPPMGIAAMAAAAAQKKQKNAGKDDSSSPPMGIAAMAAAAAQKKRQEAEECDGTSSSQPPMDIAAMAAEAAQKRQQNREDADNASSPHPMGIAAMAAAAAQKKQQNAKEDVSSPPMGIAAMAAAAAQKKQQNAEENDNASSTSPPMGIAAMAAAAARKKQQQQKADDEENMTAEPPPMGIAAMAAAAARKKQMSV